MASLRQICALGVTLALVGSASGCNMVHDLQWHRLWRMNYYSGSKTDAYYSVEDRPDECGDILHTREGAAPKDGPNRP